MQKENYALNTLFFLISSFHSVQSRLDGMRASRTILAGGSTIFRHPLFFSPHLPPFPPLNPPKSAVRLHTAPRRRVLPQQSLRCLHCSSRVSEVLPEVKAERASQAADEKASFKGGWLGTGLLKPIWRLKLTQTICRSNHKIRIPR